MISTQTRIHALALFLNLEKQCDEEVDCPNIQHSPYQEHLFEVHSHGYLVLTNEEADEKARKKVLEDAWTCGTEFISGYFKFSILEELEDSEWESFLKCLKKVQSEMGEDSNSLFLALLEDREKFADAVISGDGRGPLLSGYDSEEHYQVIVPWGDITHLAVKFMDGELGSMGKILQKALREEDLDGICIFCDWAEENNFPVDLVQELRETARVTTLFIYRQ